jgi:hypothetical protein
VPANKRLQLAPTPAWWLAAQLLASLARAAVLLARTSCRDFSVVGAPSVPTCVRHLDFA